MAYEKKNTTKTTKPKAEKKESASAKKPGKPRQSVARIGVKAIARTTARRAVTGFLGNGLLGSVAGALVSFAIRQTDKVEYNQDFGIFHKK